MRVRDYGLFLPAEAMYDPKQRQRAEGELASQKATYESQMDSFYTELAAKLGMFEKQLGFEKEKWGDTVGLEEKKLSLEELLGMRGLDIEEGYKTGVLEVEREGLDLQKLLGVRELDIEEQLGTRELDLQGEGLDLQRLLGTRELDLKEQELDLQSFSELLPYAWADQKQYEQDMLSYNKLYSNVMHSHHGLGAGSLANLNYLRSQRPDAPGSGIDLDALYQQYLR